MTDDPLLPVPAMALAVPNGADPDDHSWLDRAETVNQATGKPQPPAGSVVVLARELEDLAQDIRDVWAEASARGPMMPEVILRIHRLAVAKLARVFKRVWGQPGGISGGGSTALERMVVASLDVLRDPLRDDPGHDARRLLGVQPAGRRPEAVATGENDLARAIRDLLARRRRPTCVTLPETGEDGIKRVLRDQRTYLRAHAGTLMLRRDFPLGGRRSKLAPPDGG